MKMLDKLIALTVIVLSGTGAVAACEQYSNFTLDEIKEFRALLSKDDADPLDRLFAFEQMACSDRPNIRSYAIKQGLNTIQDPLVRNEVMFRAMMQKTRIDVEMGNSRELTKADKKFIADTGGVYSKLVTSRKEESGCISMYGNNCDSRYSLFVSGDKVELNYNKVSGVFRLSGSGELVGTLRADDHAGYTRIPAVIKLF
jgi:hypothetical protein